MKNSINYSKTGKTTYCLSTFRLHAGSLHPSSWWRLPAWSRNVDKQYGVLAVL